ncbi:MAG: IS1 family transposase [Gammaproteobacteria bacterium]|nr:IS1 family transposase [Gammaproteobacteria bacterium]
MNKLSKAKRAKILHLLCEGVSMRSIARLEAVSINTVNKLLVAAGETCRQFHNEHVRNVPITTDVQCDELWSFVYAKDRTIRTETLVAPPAEEGMGSIWTFTAIDAHSKVLLSYRIAKRRDSVSAIGFFEDLKLRIKFGETMLSICTDKLEAYWVAFCLLFLDLDSPIQLQQIRKGTTSDHSTAYVERHNLTIRMANRRYSRKTNAFSKIVANHKASMHLFMVYYNFIRIHQTLRMPPALYAGLTDTLYDFPMLVDLIDANEPQPKKPGPTKGTKYRPRTSRAKRVVLE